ncbi:type II toxin-antitoxin system HipA family toxin [Aquibaculum arenosum]|uniref:HipA domain-containing protein n=1 Tax=Aquibaculum arenosum TaxID=3032591 RepID=A0ABT5YP35_9PROT|nr:HipA domain-containing protein [Fodinicurvata sp. CAU 1616]MDF2096644.1 HipA domain-containing protein [Fodinicurvata sp. CAU 1616]
MPDVSILEVQLHGSAIGSLTHVGGDRTLFAFNDAYIHDARRPVLSLSFKDAFGGLITDLPVTQRRVGPFFANLLPEGPLREYLAERAGVNREREFFLLRALGQDLPGAVAIEPVEGLVGLSKPGELGEEGSSYERAGALRFSLAGVQLKFSAVRNRGRYGGLTIPAHGVGGEWIVKLPSTRFEGLPENEFAMMELARAIGIDVPDTQLVDLDTIEGLPDAIGSVRGLAFAIRRFDRSPEGPVHVEDFAQVFGVYPEAKYQKATLRNIAYVLSVESDDQSIAEFVRRIVFNVLIGNADMHLKNWSLIYRDRRKPALAPAYDLVSTIAYLDDDSFAQKFARSRRFVDFTYRELGLLADKAGLPRRPLAAVARETVERFLQEWHARKRHLSLPASAVSTIDRHIAGLPIVRETGA